MLANLFSGGADLLAFVLPLSIAVTNILFFPLAALWLFGASATFKRWPPVWGRPEKFFLLYLAASALSAALGLDPKHSFREIWNKDFYILIAIVLVAIVRTRAKNERLTRLFMAAALVTSLLGIVQYAVGVNLTDKTDKTFIYLPKMIESWPRPILNTLALINGRVEGTRGHPLSYAECLLFNWAIASCFLLSSKSLREMAKWMAYLGLTGAALVVSQSRGPWIAAGLILVLAMVLTPSKRAAALLFVGLFFVGLFAFVPVFRDRAESVLDKTHHSNAERMHMWQAGHEIWKAHPLLGIGPGNVKEVSVAYQTPAEKVWGPWGHLHSIYVNAVVERGLLGLLAFFLFIGSLAYEFWQALERSSNDPWASSMLKGSLLGLVGFLVSGLTETSYNSAVVMMTFYFVVGLALALARHHEDLPGI